MKAGIVGIGLMGGSLGLALRDCGLFSQIFGYDTSEINKQQALYLGLVDECISFDEIIKLDVVFLCAPIKGIVEIVKSINILSENQVIIDFGGVKKHIIESIPKHLRKNFVSLHPMCGTENFGPKAALKDLYNNQIVVFVDILDSGEYQAQLAREIFIKLGCNIIKMDCASHDNHTAFISHMPHIVSYAITNSILKQNSPADILAIAGGGFRSMSRLSKSSASIWADISAQNKTELLNALQNFKSELQNAIDLISNDEYDKLQAWLNGASKLREIL